MSSEMAWRAASLMSFGAAKSGKPCDKFTALYFIASRVISRITDSVNCSALAEIMRREISAIVDSGEFIFLRGTAAPFSAAAARFSFRSREASASRCLAACAVLRRRINHPVDGGIAQHDLHVFAGLRERNGLNQLGNLLVAAFRLPKRDAVLAGIVGSESVLGRAGEIHQAFEIVGSELNVIVGVEELVLGVFYAPLSGHQLGGLGQQLHQSVSIGVGYNVSLERGFLTNQPGYDHRIDAVFLRLAAQLRFVRQGIQRLPRLQGHVVESS